jgi:lipopolysaccharide export system protein LptA
MKAPTDMLMYHRKSPAFTAPATAALVLLLAAAASPALAQTVERQSSSFALSEDQPIQIESDQLEVSESQGRADFTGNVEVVQGEMVLKSGAMTVFYSGESGSVSTGTAAIERIELSDDVVLRSGEQTASADAGTYDMTSEMLTLSGERVVLSEGDNVLVGCKLTVDVANGNARLESCGNRVQIQLNPSSRPSE